MKNKIIIMILIICVVISPIVFGVDFSDEWGTHSSEAIESSTLQVKELNFLERIFSFFSVQTFAIIANLNQNPSIVGDLTAESTCFTGHTIMEVYSPSGFKYSESSGVKLFLSGRVYSYSNNVLLNEEGSWDIVFYLDCGGNAISDIRHIIFDVNVPCEDKCTIDGQYKCDSGGDNRIRCTTQPNGCLDWSNAISCLPGECIGGSCVALSPPTDLPIGYSCTGDSQCSSGQCDYFQCVPSGTTPELKTCSEVGGVICSDNSCSTGSFVTTSDSSRCCLGSCTTIPEDPIEPDPNIPTPGEKVLTYTTPKFNIDEEGKTATATITITNPTLETKSGLIELQARKTTETFSFVSPTELVCDIRYPENVHKKLTLEAGESKTIALTTPLTGELTGKRLFYLHSTDKCCVNEQGDPLTPACTWFIEDTPFGFGGLKVGEYDFGGEYDILCRSDFDCININGGVCIDPGTEDSYCKSKQAETCANPVKQVDVESTRTSLGCEVLNFLPIGPLGTLISSGCVINQQIDKIIEVERCSESFTKKEYSSLNDGSIMKGLCEERRNCNPRDNHDIDCVSPDSLNIKLPQNLIDRASNWFSGQEPGLCLATSTDKLDICGFLEKLSFFNLTDDDCTDGGIIAGVGLFLIFILFSMGGRRR